MKRNGIFWDTGFRVWVECPREEQFHVARQMLLEHGDNGRLKFEKGPRVGEATVVYAVGGPMPNPYVELQR